MLPDMLPDMLDDLDELLFREARTGLPKVAVPRRRAPRGLLHSLYPTTLTDQSAEQHLTQEQIFFT